MDHNSNDTSVEPEALGWESLGRYVRQRTLEAVALHFAATAEWDGILSRGFQPARSPVLTEACGSENCEPDCGRLSE